tara:strand:+ start:595 stop:1212 length:618 start_codon:yes stop_codon:yes gene_type:complete
MRDNKIKIAITCPHCDFEGKKNLFSSGSKKLCTRCKRDFIFDDSIKVKYSFYCPYCNNYRNSRSSSMGKKVICAKCRYEMFISKDGIKPLIILDKWYEWILFIFPKMIFLFYPTMLFAAPILLVVYLWFAFLPVPFGPDEEVDYFFKVLRLWFLYWIAFIIWGRKSINRLKLLANIYHRKILYYLCFLLINLISVFGFIIWFRYG